MKELDQAVSEYIEFYNTIRVHQRLGNITPLQAEKEFYANHKNWYLIFEPVSLRQSKYRDRVPVQRRHRQK